MLRVRLVLIISIVSAAAGLADPVAVGMYDDTSGEVAAISVFGNSTAPVAISGTGRAESCKETALCMVAISGTGNAACTTGFSCLSVALGDEASAGRGCIGGSTVQACGEGLAVGRGNATSESFAITLFGTARARDLALSLGDAECSRVFCLALALADSSACEGTGGNKCSAVAVTGDATACEGGGPGFQGFECLAISPVGSASSCARGSEGFACLAASGTGDASSSTAATLTGSATARPHHVLGTDIQLGALAVSGTGNATSCKGNDLCIAASGTGHAGGETAVSGCDTFAAYGRDEACEDPL